MTTRWLPIPLFVVALLALAPVAWARTPSEAIFPPAHKTVRFSHKTHRQGCDKCHASVKRSVSTRDRNLPKEAACTPCHAKSTRKTATQRQGSSKTCGRCHLGYDGAGPPARASYPAANLRFGHRPHLSRGARCADCHGGMEKIDERSRRPLPTMASCIGCHRARKADNRCVVCHLSGKDGRLLTKFDSGTLRPSGSLRGDAHNARFRRRHASVATANRRYCERCHTSRSCLRCHAGKLRPMVVHSGDYATRHAQDARRNQPRCDSCHRSQTFCLGCHQRLGVGQESAGSGFRPKTGRRFHPPGFVTVTRGPGHHSYSARRNIRTCSSCHRERTCIRCHGTRTLGRGGFSPHRAGFRGSKKCRSLAARNRRVCAKCHSLSDSKIECR